MAWSYLVAAGLFERGWAMGLKHSDWLKKPVSTVFTIAEMAMITGLKPGSAA